MTVRRYYEDAYTRIFSAQVIASTPEGVILNQTYFYPTGGGQPYDRGLINGIAVTDVITREDGTVLHQVEQPIPVGEAYAEIDWARRFDHMQHHTGQHLLTQAFVSLTGAQTVGFHLSPESVTIDLDQAVNAEQVNAVERLANQIIVENRPVIARIIAPDDREGVRLRKMPEKLYTDGLRVIEIADFDLTACGGTHVAHTGEIALIKILKTEKRGDKTRVEFRCGGRAFEDYREKAAIVGLLTADLTCGVSEIVGNVGKLRAELKAAQLTLKTATTRLIAYEANALLGEAETRTGYRLIRAVFEDRDPSELRLLAAQLVATSGIIALIGAAGDKAQVVFARSADLTVDLTPIFKMAIETIGGRGGGRPELAQGGGVPADGDQLRALMDLAAAKMD
ncbi:MAG: DHHA1 domain-containing protein [Anaerolineae bacterium]|jgi:alanyl-tRNA synthetase|nr:DHHA1 domain-containing protein [Anaerolineae bacterium]